MKKNFWLCCVLSLIAPLVAQDATNPAGPAATATAPASTPATDAAAPPALPTTPPPLPVAAATNATKTNAAPTGKSGKKSGKKKAPKTEAKRGSAKSSPAPAYETHSIPLLAGPAIVVASNVNVRGQAKLKSEVVTHLNKGDTVSVLEEIVLKKSAPDEPSAWARIILPAGTHVWVNASFVDETGKAVKATKLKMRAGPGENYSVLGMLKKGDDIKEIGRKEEWLEIEAPAQASAFVAAQYLRQEAGGPTLAAISPDTTAASTTSNAPPTLPTTVPDSLPIVPAAPDTTSSVISNETAVATLAANSNNIPATPETAVAPVPPPPRIVAREGIVRGTFSIQAPTPFELISPQNHKAINYLYSTSSDLDLRRYKGLHIIVTGEESLDERWGNTPVITVQRIQVLD
jgi:uncharacterized protein YgiM (DUF1202 family)